jgi:hypothetical protein
MNPHMNVIRSIILLVLGLSLLILAVTRLRAYKLKERYALAFLFLGLPFILLAIWPKAIEYVSISLHIAEATVMLLCVSVFLFLIIFELLTIVSQQDRKITTLAQMVGILTERQNAMERRQSNHAD